MKCEESESSGLFLKEDDKKDDTSSRHSETDLTDEETMESDDALGVGTPIPAMHSLAGESIPNSPASLSMWYSVTSIFVIHLFIIQ